MRYYKKASNPWKPYACRSNNFISMKLKYPLYVSLQQLHVCTFRSNSNILSGSGEQNRLSGIYCQFVAFIVHHFA